MWYLAPHLSWVPSSLDWFDVLSLLSFRWILRQLDFISSDSAQSMMCTVGRIQNGLKVVFCILHATPSHYHRHGDLLISIEHIGWKIAEACVNAYWVYSVESVSKMYLVLSVTYIIFFAICGVVCVELAHSSLGDREDMFITYLIIVIIS